MIFQFSLGSRLAGFELIGTLCLAVCLFAMTALGVNEHKLADWSKPALSSAERNAAHVCLRSLPRDWTFDKSRFPGASEQMNAISETAAHLQAALAADAGKRLTYAQRQQTDSELAGWNCHSSWAPFVPLRILMPTLKMKINGVECECIAELSTRSKLSGPNNMA